MGLLARLRAGYALPAPAAHPEEVSATTPTGRLTLGRPVGESSDLRRIRDLPRRRLDPEDPAAARKWTALLRKPDGGPCECVKKWGICLRELRPVQGWALEEAATCGGLLGAIGVGEGKTAVDILLAMVIPRVHSAVLLIPPDLRAQFLERDFPAWSAHFRVPNLAGGSRFVPGLPVLHVVAYSELSGAKATDLLVRLSPDVIVADEAHNLKHRTAARTKRFLRYFAEHKSTRLIALSGTITTRSIKDYGHLADLALRERSPLPRHFPTLEEWAGALDAESSTTIATPAGALASLCAPGESVRQGFSRRLVETPGVVATREGTLGVSLVLGERKVGVPESVTKALAQVRITWQRPDGEELTDGTTKAAVLRQIACGFFYRWTWPRGESPEVIRRWLEVRKNWHREIREALKHAPAFRDSPLLLARAAHRWHHGFVEGETHHPAYTRHRLTWASETWLDWLAVRDTAEPQTEAVWIDRYLAHDAASWAKERPGLVWYSHAALGEAIAALGVTHFGPGPEASSAILRERGDRSAVVSARAHGTGKNLQAWSRNLIVALSSDGAVNEQLIGRTHRSRQRADSVSVDLYLHTPEMRDALDTAMARARYMQQTTGQPQRLLYSSKAGHFAQPG